MFRSSIVRYAFLIALCLAGIFLLTQSAGVAGSGAVAPATASPPAPAVSEAPLLDKTAMGLVMAGAALFLIRPRRRTVSANEGGKA